MHYQLNLRLTSEKKEFFWLFNSEKDTVTVFDEVVKTFRKYEPRNTEAFMKEKRRELNETGESYTVQIEVVKVDREAIIRSVSYKEMWYDGEHFQEIYRTLTEKLGTPEEESIA